MTTHGVPIVDLRRRGAVYDALFATHAALIPGKDHLRREANRKMAKEALWRACSAYRRRMDTTPVAELIGFARSTYPGLDHLSEYWDLRWR